MTRNAMVVVGLAVLGMFLASGCMPKQMYGHGVYFTLKDGVSDAARDAQVKDAKVLLGQVDSVKWVDSGLRDPAADRDVNNQTFHIGLHVYFEDKAGLDAYIDHPKHVEYVEKYKENWETVEVFDYLIEDENFKAKY